MATVRSVDFLPQIFQTETNRQFLNATLDQLIQEPRFKKTQGFIGRTVGPGVNPNDRYVVEPTQSRTDYQLEPGVVSLEPDTDRIKNVITYPGINDAVDFYGGNSSRPDRLYSSEYYTWDPFVNLDSFINFSQYYWLPNGPDVVDVQSEGIATTDTFVVTRENGVYTFSGISGENPVIELVRGGSYSFQVAQNAKETVNFRVTNNRTTAYVIDYQSNPVLTLARGNTYVFNLSLNTDSPFWIKTQPTTGLGDVYASGVSRNGATAGQITFVVPQDAPDTLFYASQNHADMQGQINIVDGVPGTGPGFWIQAAPGINGRMPATPNISSRDVFGVSNNGEDLGTVIFNVPTKTQQNFFYNLTDYGSVDLISDLKFDQINNVSLAEFLVRHGGIDGTTNLDGRTLVFTETQTDAVAGGWIRNTLYDPLPDGETGQPGSYDTTLYDQAQPVPVEDRNQLWQINYVQISGYTYLSLSKISDIPNLNRFKIRYGTNNSNTQWYKDAAGKLKQIPLLTAAQDTLYYQDGTDPEIFGKIRLIEQSQSQDINVDDIVGQTVYTSPNGVVFTNGLKVRFVGQVTPAQYRSGVFELLITSSQAGSNYLTTISTASLYVGEAITFVEGQTIGGLLPGTYYVQSIAPNGIQFTVSAVPYGPVIPLDNATVALPGVTAILTADRQFYVSGVGSAIQLLPVENFRVVETYATDSNSNTLLVEPTDPDYLTIDRASADLNAWTRSNRWFHSDVINATAQYNNTVAVFDNNYRAKRPIIEFRPGIRLWNMGTEGKQPVDVIDFEETDAFSNIQGTTGYTVNGYTLVDGTRIVFAADEDQNVRNKIYVVNFVVPDTVDPLIPQPIINLSLANDGQVLEGQSTAVLNSGTFAQPVPADQAGKTYWFDGSQWALAQQKTGIQQAPLFDVYDSDGVSFGNQNKYQSSTFAGSKLFSYAVGDTTILDPVLRFPLKYLNINNVGDIVFENNLYQDTFLYVEDNASVTLDISAGSVREYSNRVKYSRKIGWQPAATETQIRQQFRFNYTGQTLKLDVRVNQPSNNINPIKLYVGSVYQSPDSYTYTTTDNSTTITLSREYAPDDVIEVTVLSDQTSSQGFYQVPLNLQNNPLNGNSNSFTLGTVRTHYESICQTRSGVVGNINGANNTRDLGNIIPYGQTILQQSAPLTLAGYFLRSTDYNIFSSLAYNAREYNKFKYQMLDQVTRQVINFQTPAEVLDSVIEEITQGRTETQSFYWSDMLPSGSVYTSTTYTVGMVVSYVYDTVQVYNYRSSNYLGMNVYLNNEILVRGVDYVVAVDGPRIEILASLFPGDVLVIREYSATYGSFVPNTPSKMGLYPTFQPGIITQATSSGLVEVIQGHDGSITPLFGDVRDQVLLEFETRIYNNIKMDLNPVPLEVYNVLPGQFRETGYTYSEVNSVLQQDFLSYVGANKLDYRTQAYSAANEFSWNYSGSRNKLNDQQLLGAWRGIYRYFFDTEQPQYTPWEMLGLSQEPEWWQTTYGEAPYTSGNFVLWDDIEAGLVRDPVSPYVRPEFARPGLTDVLPVDDQGQLLSPFECVVGNYNQTSFQKSWAPGDGSPVEASWWNSSSYPFAVMQLLALTRPAKFFALFADRDLYRYSEEFGQYLYNNRYRLDANGIEVYGNGLSKASYINWIVDYNRQTGINSTDTLSADLKSLDVRLCYRMASFSDKQYIKLYTEKSSPNSTNTALLIPDESYDLVLYKNQPFDRTVYSAVVVQKVPGGYAVFGYGTARPYFEILQSRTSGLLRTIDAGGVSVRVAVEYTDQTVQVPYGFVFSNQTSVCDFLLSYGQLLAQRGIVFDDRVNGYTLSWDQMAQEFLYWSQQGWDDNALLNLNPLAFRMTVTRDLAVVDSIRAQTVDSALLDQNRRELPTRNLNIVRVGNTFSCEPLSDQTLSFVDIKFTNYEHMIVLKNQSVFGDLIYQPLTGARQSRLNLVCVNTSDWTGQVDAPGFILNQNNVEEWTGLRTYSKGEIVKYKNVYWSALKIVQPSERFDFNDWVQSDYDQIELGLLPNLANKADQLVNSYNINTANIESDNDLLSYGLIGFRPREYMAALNLDDVSQVNVYRQFLGSKGTIQAAELFAGANLGKETADYNIYENWAVQRAVYGANANRSFVELRLNRALLNSNPSIVQVIQPEQASEADQTILFGDIWKQSFKLTSPDFLPTVAVPDADTALPSAGYVNLDDADITVFDIADIGQLNANLDAIAVGSRIWVAKVNSYNWNIYRAENVPGSIQHVCDNLDGTSRVIFDTAHDLDPGSLLIIKFFDEEVNGVYRVLSAPALNTVNIEFEFTGDRTVANGTGVGFTLATMRVAQASDIVNLPYAQSIAPGARVWVDNNGEGQWAVLEKQDIFTAGQDFKPMVDQSSEQFATAVAQTSNLTATLIGSPGYRLPENYSQWAATDAYRLNDIVYQAQDGQDQFYQVTAVLSGSTTIAPASLVPGLSVVITSLGDTDWNVVAGTVGVTYTVDSTLVVAAVGSGTGTVKYLYADQVEPGTLLTNTDFWTPYSLSSVRRGAVYVTVRNSQTAQLSSPLSNRDAVLTIENLNPTGSVASRGFGNAVDFGSTAWAVAGASGSLGVSGTSGLSVTDQPNNGYAAVIYQDPAASSLGNIPYSLWQVLPQPESTVTAGAGPSTWTTPGAGEFGYSVAMSQDERWMYVSAPGLNRVHAYSRVDYPSQFVQYQGDGVETEFDISTAIVISDDAQISVRVNGQLQALGSDYTVDSFETVVFAQPPADEADIEIVRNELIQLDHGSYYDVAPSATSGSGTGARFTVVRTRGVVTVGATNPGQDYAPGDTVTIAAASFGGGISPFNNIVLTITTVGGNGEIDSFSTSYTPGSLASIFVLKSRLYSVTTEYSFTVIVNGVVQRPLIDYQFNSNPAFKAILFAATSVPPLGATILVRAQSYFEHVSTISVSGLAAGARFGQSISCSTDGRQLLIGTPNQAVTDPESGTSQEQAGSVYVFDRNVQRFVYGPDSTNQFEVLGSVTEPVSVLVNSQFLINQDCALPSATNTFSVSGNTITVNQPLEIGDVVEIETNQFQQVQQITQNAVAEFSNFGSSVELCSYNCSLYVGEPQSSLQVFKGGSVQRNVNQARTYGTIVSQHVYQGVQDPQADYLPSFAPGMYEDAGILNGRQQYEFVAALTAGQTLRINNQDVAVPASPNNTLVALQDAINAQVPNVLASVVGAGQLSITVKNSAAAPAGNKLQVAPGSVGTLFDTMGFATFVFTQNIFSPYPVEYAGFGSEISIDDSATALAVGSPRGTTYLIALFDDNDTDFDDDSTVFFSTVLQSGAVYEYDYLSSAAPSVANPGKFVFGQQIVSPDLGTYDLFGSAINYVGGSLAVGAPANDNQDTAQDYGRLFLYQNPDRRPAWAVVAQQKPVVDMRLLNSVFTYDRITSETTQFYDFFDPLQGKILGAARQNIDYISSFDPASYNAGGVRVTGTTWAENHVGQVWWDTSTVRFVDPNQDDIVYAARRWGQVFPGSSVDVYQWIRSTTPPANYTGPGTPYSIESYTVNSRLNRDGVITAEYYFWVRGITTAATQQGKTLSVATVAQYIENPRSSGIAYLAPINASTVALYNAGDYIEAFDTVLNIEFDRELTNSNVHVEYELIAQDRADAFISGTLYRKLQDSFCGVDTAGNQVPDPNLSPAERYGIQFRPRQSMFVDRFAALRNYLTRANTVMAQYPMAENRLLNLLNSAEPEPPAGHWNLRVANLEILSYQDIDAVALGYRYLVESDSNNNGRWTVYEVQESDVTPDRQLVLVQVQGYVTRDFWDYVTWYRPGFNPSTRVIAELDNVSQLDQLNVPVGSAARIRANSSGKFEIYQLQDTGWQRVALQDGTIRFSSELWDYQQGRFGFDIEVFDAQYFDQEPTTETRKIIQAINEELFVDDLAIERNRLLTLVFGFVLSEFSAPEWLIKTSLVDVDHRIRDLVPYQNYRRDNQEFVLDYIQEVKPYHVQIREFNLRYNGQDQFLGSLSDFDLPAYFNTALQVPQYTSPVLLPYAHSSAEISNRLSDVSSSNPLWLQFPYNQWFNNYLLSIDSIEMLPGRNGSGYTEPPQVIIQGDAIDPAEAVAVINSAGQVVAVQVTRPGSGYRSLPTVVFDGGNGTGAQAIVRASNSAVRSFKTTIKFDRTQYRATVVDWSSDGVYQNGQLVRYVDRVWRAANPDSSEVTGPTFDLENWQEVPAGDLSGADRTMGLLVPGATQPGLELPLLFKGVSYPGVQVYGAGFTSTVERDADYSSEFTDILLGDRFTDINVDGGKFVGPYEGHAPEELVNGVEFDTVDIRVYTRPGSDWQFDGHGFETKAVRYRFDSTSTVYSWSGLVQHPVQVLLSNLTTGRDLAAGIDYVIEWRDQTVDIIGGASNGDTINVAVYELGGGSQLYRANYVGSDVIRVVDGEFVIIPVSVPVDAAEIQTVAVFKNGQQISDITWEAYTESINWGDLETYERLTVVKHEGSYYRAMQFVPVGIDITNTAYWLPFVPAQESLVYFGDNTFEFNDGIAIVVFGSTGEIDYSWSTPQVNTVVVDAGMVTSRIVPLDLSLQGTNPANMVVTRNGLRLRPADGIEWVGDDSTVEFALPNRGGFSQSLISAPTDVSVWVNGVLQQQSFGAITGVYSVTNWDGSEGSRRVVFDQAPAAGSLILIAVDTLADYQVTPSGIQISAPFNVDDVIQVIAWNDTRQQNILTQVFQGPIITGVTLNEPYDSTDYDSGSVTGDPGSFDYTEGTAIPVNDLWLRRPNVNASRLWVTINGYRLFEGEDFSVEGEYLILAAGVIRPTDVVVVTEFTDSVVPETMAFRIFQDMRGVQATYRITPKTTAYLTVPMSAGDTAAFVSDASVLSEPDLARGILGVVMIDSERIMYRERDVAAKVISGLVRGTAGTAAADHAPWAEITDMSRGNLLYAEYQDRADTVTTVADGSSAEFSAPEVSTAQAWEVYVGGIRQYSYSDSTVALQVGQYRWIPNESLNGVEFVETSEYPALTVPPANVEVTVLVRRGLSWYTPGVDTASNGRALQETENRAARFLRGL